MVKLSLLRRLEVAEDTALPPDDPVINERQRRLEAILATDPSYQSALAMARQFGSAAECLADEACRAGAKTIAHSLAAANKQLEG